MKNRNRNDKKVDRHIAPFYGFLRAVLVPLQFADRVIQKLHSGGAIRIIFIALDDGGSNELSGKSHLF